MSVFQIIPEAQRDVARAAAIMTFGPNAITSVQLVSGGASGALTYRLDMNDKPYLLRLETRRSPLRNPHQYVCMKAAAGAGIAPPVLYADDADGIAIMAFLQQRPFHEYPGGRLALVQAAGTLLSKLQQNASFPEFGDYRTIVGRMLSYMQRAFMPGLLAPHMDVFERIRNSYPWDHAQHVASHNDLNPGNILFDGNRLWLIDWETSYRNDPLTDIAILAENFAKTPDLENALLQSWLGQAPDHGLRARFTLMRKLTRLYYAGLLLATSIAPGAEPIADLSAPNPDQFRSQLATGQLKIGATETRMLFGKIMLAEFLAGTQTAAFEDALHAART